MIHRILFILIQLQFPLWDWDTTIQDARFIEIMIKACNSKHGIEVGTYRGHGTGYMARGFQYTNGHLWTYEIEEKYVEIAKKHLNDIGLSEYVTFVVGDAVDTLKQHSGAVDFVFIDAEKKEYLSYLKSMEPNLKTGCAIVADNAIRKADEMQDFLSYVKNSPLYNVVVITASDLKKDGLLLAIKEK